MAFFPAISQFLFFKIMAHIPVEAHLPGITGLLEYRKDTAQPIRELTQILLRGPSTLTEGEREYDRRRPHVMRAHKIDHELGILLKHWEITAAGPSI